MVTISISAVIPIFNEVNNLEPLHNELIQVLKKITSNFEIILVDDGSRDGSLKKCLELRSKDNRIKVIELRRNYGQTAALDAGIKLAQKKFIVTLDADLQNDPNDILHMLDMVKYGYDMVIGWRWNRRDPFSKKFISRIAYTLRVFLLKDTLHDYGCTLKLFKKECFDDFTLFGEMHRYIPPIMKFRGFKVGEIKVNHRPRFTGNTKYNFHRIFRGFFDLLFLKFWNDYSSRPIHFFGMFAISQLLLASLIFIEQIAKALVTNKLTVGPLLILVMMLVITGLLTFCFGFLAEILVRTYYGKKPNYSIKKINR